MNFSDRWLTCVDCGKEFLWDAGEQAWFSSNRLANQPKRCKKCRDQRRDRHLPHALPATQVNCDQCGAPTYVPFLPQGTKPIYCRMCLTAVRA
ncbi:MAG: zinc-binding protein [Chloroflexi bacterium]|nr:zinc-binding protein [Chloroflexota bacterium]